MIPGELILAIKQIHQKADPAHNWRHIENVVNHVNRALLAHDYNLKDWQEEAVILAAYLHEISDPKLKLPSDHLQSLLDKYLSNHPQQAKLVTEIISLVSTRNNHQTIEDYTATDRWKYLVRDADRLEAIGEVGIARCYAYTVAAKKPFFIPQTPQFYSEDQLFKTITTERFERYNGNSESMVDHFYDKLLHLTETTSGNQYLQAEMKKRYPAMVNFVINFGRRGKLDLIWLESIKFKHCLKGVS